VFLAAEREILNLISYVSANDISGGEGKSKFCLWDL
jgi:hypothetical protein